VTFGWHTDAPPPASAPATPGNDYLPRAAFATIPAGQTSVLLDVLTKGDGAAESNETIAVKVDPGSTSVPVLQDGEITIVDAGTQTPAPPPTPTTTTTTTSAPPPTAPATTVPPTTVPPTSPPTTAPPATTSPPTTTPPVTTPPSTAPPLPPPPTTAAAVAGPSSSNLADFVNMPGDEVVKVPNGYYHGGEIDTAHPATTGPYKGWLVLVAQSQGNVIVDLSTAPLTLGPNTSRVMFVGFTFVNGSVFVAGNDITFWYTQHTFPADVWAHQAPDPQNPSSGLYRAPRTVYVRDGAQRVRFYGSDLHDTATAFSVTNTTDVLLDGVTTWNLSDLGMDPQDVVHPDAIAAVSGNNTGFTVADSWIRGRVMIQDEANDGSGGPQVGLVFKHLWVSGSPSSGFTFTAAKPAGSGGVFGVRDDVRSWGHKNGYDRIDIVDGVQYHDANAQPSRIDVTDSAISTTAPSYGMVSPADQWRAAHPLDSWPEMIDGQL
ncbi:MAG: hypothetical protein JWL83_778, partial [Actinomycetia bacterium]|nr:hypothetical protein [Actinomycetes bacterium]